jgi:hypothetical protein
MKTNNERPSWYVAPIEDAEIFIGSLTCSTACRQAPLDMWVAVGFGSAYATRDSEVVYCESSEENAEILTVGDIEKMAADDPYHDWRITKYGPLHGETFQRHGEGVWMCIASNEGFA